MLYLSKPNRKTGEISFDLPAKKTCPGMTTGPQGCASKCYAARLADYRPHVAKAYVRNLRFAHSTKFVPWMVRSIPYRSTIRIHVSGDFYSPEYVNKWIEIASRRKDVIFYCYTRSWRIPSIWKRLQRFAALPNVTINISCDWETKRPGAAFNDYKWCFMTLDDSVPDWLRPTDLVFRFKGRYHKRSRKLAIKKNKDPEIYPLIHRLGSTNVSVCPLERGADIPLTCSRCRICIK